MRPAVVGTLLAVTAAGTSLQARLNASLLDITGNAAEVSLVNLSAGFLVVTGFVLARPTLRRAWRIAATGLRRGELRPWEVLGGLGGAYFVAVQAVGAQIIGVAVFTVAVVAGQTWSAMALDRIGLGPAGRLPVTRRRVLAAVLAIAAVGVPAWDRVSAPAAGVAVVIVVLLAASAGAASSVQGALNGRVGRYAGHPIIGAWGNFALGSAVLALAVGVSIGLSPADWGGLPWGQPWLLAAGTLGLAYVATATWAVRVMGVLLTSLISVGGLLGGALAVDLVSPTAGATVGWALAIGVGVSAASVAVATGRRRT